MQDGILCPEGVAQVELLPVLRMEPLHKLMVEDVCLTIHNLLHCSSVPESI